MATQQVARLVVPLDTSATAETVIPWAALMARDRAMEVHLVAVWSDAAPIPGIDSSKPTGEIVAELQIYLDGVARQPPLDTVHVTTEVRTGDVVGQIKTVAQERPGSMVMLASHGQGGYQEAYLGSVTDKLLRTLHVPVLVIPARPGPG